jgi:hypothetical protein
MFHLSSQIQHYCIGGESRKKQNAQPQLVLPNGIQIIGRLDHVYRTLLECLCQDQAKTREENASFWLLYLEKCPPIGQERQCCCYGHRTPCPLSLAIAPRHHGYRGRDHVQ